MFRKTLLSVALLLGACLLPGRLWAADPSAAEVERLRQQIWADIQVVTDSQAKAPPARRATGKALTALQLAARAPAIEALWRIGAGEPRTPAGLAALTLVFQWGPGDLASQAFRDLVTTRRDDDALATALEAGYAESLAPDKRARLNALVHDTKSRAVAGSGRYILAFETLSDPATGRSPARQASARNQMRRVRDDYGDIPTTFLGGGEPPRLGRVAAAYLFKTERLSPGHSLPVMTARDLEGARVTSASLPRKTTLIVFWATWCPPCVASLPDLKALNASARDAGLQIVSISADANAEAVKAFVQRQGMTWRQWITGPSGTVSPEWSNSDYPFYLLVSRSGVILATSQHLQDILARVKDARQRQ
jgi:thiol-disulfide isomerase/thioredoxin